MNTSQPIEEKSFDVCIVGAGPAGLTMANELQRNFGKKVILIESGEENKPFEEASRYESIGSTKYKPVRTFILGGHSHFWGGACPRMHPNDFKMKSLFNVYNDWPINYQDLIPYYISAEKLLKVNNVQIDPLTVRSYRNKGNFFQRFMSDNIHENKWMYPYGNRRYFLDELLPEVKRNKKITIKTGLTAVRIRMNQNEVAAIECKNKAKDRMLVKAKTYVLAMGGLSNARLCQLSTSEFYKNGVGGSSNWLGVGHMDHPLFAISASCHAQVPEIIEQARPSPTNFQPPVTETPEISYVVKNYSTSSYKFPIQIDSVFKALEKGLVGQKLEEVVYSNTTPIAENKIEFEFADWPDKKNTLELSKTKNDIFGDPILATNMNCEEARNKTIEFLQKKYIPILQKLDKELIDISIHKTHYTGQHPSGSTRMSSIANEGVVDSNLKVHAVDNLYVVGSSVFPTVGYSNPTLTIIALALRLSKHLGSVWNRYGSK